MAVAHSLAERPAHVVSRWCGDLPVTAYRQAIDLLIAARDRKKGRETRILKAQQILMERLINPPAGGLGQRLTEFHEYLYDRLSYAHLLQDRLVIDEVVWKLREICEYCVYVEGIGEPVRRFGGMS